MATVPPRSGAPTRTRSTSASSPARPTGDSWTSVPIWLAFASAWRDEYQPAMDEVRTGRIPFARLDVLHRRMLDKIRLNAAGRLPAGYNLGAQVWTWFDARCTRFLGVNYEALAGRVLTGGTDEEMLQWCFKQGRQPSQEEIEIWNEFMTKRGWRDSSSAALAEAKRLRGFANRDDIQTAFEFHLADESSDGVAPA